MKIKLRAGDTDYTATLDVGVMHVELVDVFNGILLKTDQGEFGICQRDAGIEVLLNGEMIFASTTVDDG